MSDVNPYAAPEEVNPASADTIDTIGGMPIASQNRRFVNFLVDNILVRILATMGGAAIGFSYAAANNGQIQPSELAGLELLGMAVGLAIAVFYYLFLEAAFGITIGKLLSGTRVVRADGGAAGFGQLVGRSFARMIPFEPLSFLFGDKTTGWHDSLSGTRVVYTR